MSTRLIIDAAALANGWEVVPAKIPSWQDYVRPARVNPGKLAKIAEAGGYELREGITVQFSGTGGIIGAVRRTPHDQAATDGRWLGFSEEARGKNKKGQVLAWLAIELQY